MKRIIVPTDLSAYAKNAFRIAAQLATKTDGEVLLLNANEQIVYANPLGEFYTYDKSLDDTYLQAVSEGMATFIQEIKDDDVLAKVPVRTIIETGTLTNVIEQIIAEQAADLVVMGTHGASGMEEFVVGSNTQKVIRKAACPVLSVPLAFTKSGFDTIVFPTTLKDDQTAAFRKLATFQKLFGSSINLVYLNNPAHLPDDQSIEELAHKRAAEAGLERVDVFISKENVFNEEEAILNFATEQKADLIAMGTHQRKGLSHLIFGSITEDTLNHANIPVLSIPLN